MNSTIPTPSPTSDNSETTPVPAPSCRVLRSGRSGLKGRLLSGTYRLTNVLSHGGMGTIYLARNIKNSKQYAIKVLRADFELDHKVRERFFMEFRAEKRIRHPAVVQAIETGETPDGKLFLVMEYVNGKTLRNYLKKGPVHPSRAIMFMGAIAEGLKAAHQAGIIHRDLKPENILIPRRDDGQSLIKIVDFGIAHRLDSPRITTTSHVLGTPSYAAPEQVMGQVMGHPITPRSDIYSFGVISYEMLSGQLPYKTKSPEDILRAYTLDTPPFPVPDIASLTPIPTSLKTIVMDCLNNDPHLRPHDMEEILQRLNQMTGA